MENRIYLGGMAKSVIVLVAKKKYKGLHHGRVVQEISADRHYGTDLGKQFCSPRQKKKHHMHLYRVLENELRNLF